MASFVTDDVRGVALAADEPASHAFAVADTRSAGAVGLEVWSSTLSAELTAAETPAELVTARAVGAPTVPEWSQTRRDHRPAGRHDRGPPRARSAAGGGRRDLRRLAAGLVGPAHHRLRRPAVVDLAARPRALPRLGAAGRRPRPAGHRGHDLREPVPRRRGAQGGRHDPQPLRRGERGRGTSSRGRAARRTSSTRAGSTRRWSTSATRRRATGTPT